MWIIERKRLPLFIPVILSFGIIYGVNFPLLSFTRAIVLILSSVIFACVYRRHYISLVILVFSIGIYVAQTGGPFKTDLIIHKKYLDHHIEKTDFYANVGFIEETHPTMKNMQRLILNDVKFCDKNLDENLDYIKTIKMTCSSKMLKGISPMDGVKCMGSFSPFKGTAIPGGFDQLQYNSIMGLDASGVVFYIRHSSHYPQVTNLMENFSYMRFVMTKSISQKIKGDASGVASALLTGDKSSISQEVRDSFIRSGTAHILAISGLHMTIVASILYFLLSRILLYIGCIFPRINASSTAAAVTILLTFLYLALSGFSPSAIRAFIMTTICLISLIMGRRALSMRNVAIAAFLILFFNPGSLFHVSFQLSFSAVIALISFYETYESKFTSLRYETSFIKKFFIYVLMSCITTTIATIATTPISISTFNRFSAQNILGNLIAIPITSFLIAPLGVANVFLGYFTNIFIKPLELVINLMIDLTRIISHLPGTDIALKSPSSAVMYAIVVGAVFLFAFKTKLRYIGAFLIIPSVLFYFFVQENPRIIFVPGKDNIVCVIEDNVIYTNTKRKGRNKIKAIARNLGLKEHSIKTLDENYKIPQYEYSKEQGLFIWKNGEMKQIAVKKHPFAQSAFCQAETVFEKNE